jgi:hypothetical protein
MQLFNGSKKLRIINHFSLISAVHDCVEGFGKVEGDGVDRKDSLSFTTLKLLPLFLQTIDPIRNAKKISFIMISVQVRDQSRRA